MSTDSGDSFALIRSINRSVLIAEPVFGGGSTSNVIRSPMSRSRNCGHNVAGLPSGRTKIFSTRSSGFLNSSKLNETTVVAY